MGKRKKDVFRAPKVSAHHTSTHHICPKSRGGKSTEPNLTEKEIQFHQAFHLLFSNALPVEVIHILLKEWFNMAQWESDVRVQDFCDLVSSVTESSERKGH